MRIDAHVHYWRPADGFDNRPIADHEAYRRDFLPEYLLPHLEACRIDGVVLVQTCPQTAESDWLIDLAADDARVFGVTAWVDLDAPACDFTALAKRPKVVGIRAQLRRIADSQFVTRERVVANLSEALRAGLNVTILAEARHYAPVASVLQRLPDGPVTLNHLGLPFPDVDRAAWCTMMHTFAYRRDAFVQLSGLPFLYGNEWKQSRASELLDTAFDILGPTRLMFASDWPMMLRFATYEQWVEAVEALLARRGLSHEEQEALFAGNVLRANPRMRVPARVSLRSTNLSTHPAGDAR